ncbi:MAG: S8 family serine peptidase [Crocosphaera sp.]|nr:S8 family serine peptidase [Crocosphaera sp.]
MATLYAIDSATNIVYAINSLKGTAIPFGQLGLQSDFSGLSSDFTESSDEETLFASNLFDSLNPESLSTVDLATGQATVVGAQTASDIHAIAHQEGILYGFSVAEGLGTLNPETGEFTPSFDSSTFPVSMKGADVDESTNTLFAIGEDNALYMIEPSTGEATLVGETGVNFNSRVGLAYSPEDEQLYALGDDSDSGNNLYQIDKTTGAASLIGNTGIEEADTLETVQVEFESIGNEPPPNPLPEDAETNQVIIKVDPGMSPVEMESALESVDGEVIETTQTLGIQLVEVGVDVEEAVSILNSNPQVEYAEPNFVVSITQTFPNDPRFDELYGLNNTGQTGGTPDADIDAPEAWDLQTGSTDVVIGVIDTGVDYNHPDLDDNMWTNPGEIPDNGIDDDGNGFIDDFFGYDFINDDGDPFDDNGHGTHVSGTIAAEGNNGIGVTGTSWDGQIMALKFLGAGGSGSTFDAIQAVEYATMMGADLTSNSWGGGGFSEGLRDAIAAAGDAGQLFIASAGNSSSNNDIFPHYPSSYDLDNVIAVAATDDDDNLAGFSSFGATSVDLGAPGVDILSSLPGGGYGFKSGTSMAAPHVAGVASLLLAEEPGLSAEAVKDLILTGVDPLPDLEGITLTGGRLNAFNSLSELGPPAELIGTSEDDVISGTNRGDFINGLDGNDILEGRGGDDEVLGGFGDDDIGGGEGNDTLSGEEGRDRISGGSGQDSLSGGENADRLIGGSQNDNLDGGGGDDQLIGVELADSSSEFGANEVDTLAGGAGRDSVVLGDQIRVYYDDGNPLVRGESDFALFSDFNPSQDSIELAGSVDLYRLDFFTSEAGTIDAALLFDPGVSTRYEKIAILQGVSPDLSLSSPGFKFVDSEVGMTTVDTDSGSTAESETRDDTSDSTTLSDEGVSIAATPTLDNGLLTIDIREDNGAIDTALFAGSDFFNPGSPISDFGFQNGTDTSTFVRNTTTGLTQQPVTVNSNGEVVVIGTYTGGGANVDFTRTYSLDDDLNVLNIKTEFVNNGSDLTLSYFDTFDPDQGIDRGNGFSTFNDVFTLETAGGTAKVGQASELDDLTFILGSLNPDATIASGSPFVISDGFTLNEFFDSPFDGNGELADQGTHIGIRLDLDAGETESFEYSQAYGESPEEAQEQFIESVEPIIPIVGTEGDDVLTGTDSRDLIQGLGGNDIIEGLAGNDTISGGRGNDLISAGDGKDSVTGNGGHDSILAGNGDDRIDGGAESDRLLGESGDDTVNGGDGNDTILGGADSDSLFGDAERDLIFGGTEDDTLNGGNGNDTLEGGFGNDSLTGEAGNDRLVGVDLSNPGDQLGFGAGEVDTLTGGRGQNTFVLGNASNVFYDDGDPLTTGDSDLAFITDFDSSLDFIQLKGSADLYILDFFTSVSGTIDADLLYDPGVTARSEVIATLQDVSSDLSLADPAFTFA